MFVTVLLLACALTGAVVFWVCRMQQKDVAREAQLANQLQNAQATELVANDIAATIHDGPSQVLAVSIIRLETLLEDWPDGKPAPPSFREPLTRVVAVLKDTANTLHHIARDNMLPEMSGLPLQRVLARVVFEFTKQTGVAVATRWDEQPVTIFASGIVNSAVFRCVREALNNAAKHAGGRGVAVSLRVRERKVKITVTDEGPGFDASTLTDGKRLGLSLMRARVKDIGGRLWFYQNAPQGCGVEISFEVEN